MNFFKPQILSYDSFGTASGINEAEGIELEKSIYNAQSAFFQLLKEQKAYAIFDSNKIKVGDNIVLRLDLIDKEDPTKKIAAFVYLQKVLGSTPQEKHFYRIIESIPSGIDKNSGYVMIEPSIQIGEGGVFPFFMLDPNSSEFGKEIALNDFQWWAKTDEYYKWLKEIGNENDYKKIVSEGEEFQEFIDVEDFFDPYSWINREFVNEDFTSDSFRHFVLNIIMENKTFSEDSHGNTLEINENGIFDFDKEAFIAEWNYGTVLANINEKSYDEFWINIGEQIYESFTDLYNMELSNIEEALKLYEAEEVSPKEESKGSSIWSSVAQTGGMLLAWNVGSKILGRLTKSAKTVLGNNNPRVLGGQYSRDVVRSLSNRWSVDPNAPKINTPKVASNPERLKAISGAILSPFKFIGKTATGQKIAGPALKLFQGSAKGASTVANAARFAGGAQIAGGEAAAVATGAAASATVAAAWAAIAGIQRTWNWLSTNQAPRYGNVEDFAVNHFAPKEVPFGQLITLCWTQESDSNFGDLLGFNTDSRTTVSMVKIIETDKYSIFQILSSQSKDFSKKLEDINTTVLMRFENSADFKRGILDNDDLSVSIATITDPSSHTSLSIFHAWAGKEEFEDAKSKVGPMVTTFDPAPGEYLFNYKDGDSRVNVKGVFRPIDQIKSSDLGIKESEENKGWIDTIKEFFSPSKSSSKNESLDIKGFKDFNEYDNDLSFDNFIGEEEQTSKEIKPLRFCIYDITVAKYANEDISESPNRLSESFLIFDLKSLNAKDKEPVNISYYSGKNSLLYLDAKAGWVKVGSGEGNGSGDRDNDGNNGNDGNDGNRDNNNGEGNGSGDNNIEERPGERFIGIRHKERGEVAGGKDRILKVTDPTNDDADLWNGSELSDVEKQRFEEVKKSVNMDGPPWTKVGFYKMRRDKDGHVDRVIFNTRKDRLGERKVFKEGDGSLQDAIELINWLEFERQRIKDPNLEIPKSLLNPTKKKFNTEFKEI